MSELCVVLNCVRLLTRILPFLFEHAEWRDLFWSPITVSEVCFCVCVYIYGDYHDCCGYLLIQCVSTISYEVHDSTV